jgi:hypothetical protein
VPIHQADHRTSHRTSLGAARYNRIQSHRVGLIGRTRLRSALLVAGRHTCRRQSRRRRLIDAIVAGIAAAAAKAAGKQQNDDMRTVNHTLPASRLDDRDRTARWSRQAERPLVAEGVRKRQPHKPVASEEDSEILNFSRMHPLPMPRSERSNEGLHPAFWWRNGRTAHIWVRSKVFDCDRTRAIRSQSRAMTPRQ